MTGTTFGRRPLVTAGLALLVSVATRRSVHAGAINKEAFKEGCQSGGGSYIDNPDGTFQCNTSGGNTIKCFKDDTCISIPKNATIVTGSSSGSQWGGVMTSDGLITMVDASAWIETSGESPSEAIQPADGEDHSSYVGNKGKKRKKGGKTRRK